MGVSRFRLHARGAFLALACLLACATPPGLAQAPPQPPTAEQLAEQLRAAEARNRDLFGRLERLEREQGEQTKQLYERVADLTRRLDPAGEPGRPNGAAAPGAAAPGASASPVPDYTEGHIAPFLPAPGYPGSNAISPYRFPLRAVFGPGVRLFTEDDKFRLDIHYESQIEGRVWAPDEVPARSGFYLPRQRFFFDGHLTKFIEYEISINRGLNAINLLNAYINLHFDDRLQLRFGRFFTPLPYDQYAISNYWLPTPERSVFTTNLGLNRQVGAMAWGYLFGERLDYAAGVFNGSRNSFENLDNNVDVVGYVNARPFQNAERLPALKFLNLGSSVAFGRQSQGPVPASFRIAGGSPDANIPGVAVVPFLVLNRGVAEQGDRLVGSVHAAYFYKSLSLIGEWQYGYGNYTTPAAAAPVRVPYSGFYVSGGYFLTGEEVERRTRVKPRRPLVPLDKDQARGFGAWELAGRVSQLRLGEQVFDAGLADRNVWSNSVVTTEVGLNWYWNEYVKVYMFWLNGQFGDPVQFRPGRSQSSANLFWMRFQLYF